MQAVLLGDANVGKSNILRRLTNQEFNENSRPTICVDIGVKSFNFDGNQVKLKLLDTASKEEYRSIIQAFYNCAQGIFFVFDITNRSSFEAIKGWIKDVESVKKGVRDVSHRKQE
eukprot:TRINITY_DN5975_c0_g1_i1.p1 TRINITY_DN5975_c0_g1~~TRINITY_DN5975_c0_g1_i1.p1  ORF type:complete len:115 (+),score=33.04 TRINITY_DN5975_c0_g1_i1:88-432(+)